MPKTTKAKSAKTAAGKKKIANKAKPIPQPKSMPLLGASGPTIKNN